MYSSISRETTESVSYNKHRKFKSVFVMRDEQYLLSHISFFFFTKRGKES